MRVLVVLCSLVYLTSALPTLYNVDEESNVADPVLVPVSSTGKSILAGTQSQALSVAQETYFCSVCLVIPLEDLPELQVGFGFGLVEKDKVKKPTVYPLSNKFWHHHISKALSG